MSINNPIPWKKKLTGVAAELNLSRCPHRRNVKVAAKSGKLVAKPEDFATSQEKSALSRAKPPPTNAKSEASRKNPPPSQKMSPLSQEKSVPGLAF